MNQRRVKMLILLAACGIAFVGGCGGKEVTFVFPAHDGVVKLPPRTKVKPFFRYGGEWVQATNTVDLSGWTASYITPEEEAEDLDDS